MISYKVARYWYHVSSTLTEKFYLIDPVGFEDHKNYDDTEPTCDRFCVAPSIEKCLVAIPYCIHQTLTVYRTLSKEIASNPTDVFDRHITHEGWILSPVNVVLIGTIDFTTIPPWLALEGFVCLFVSFTPETKTLLASGKTLTTSPIFPLSFPVITFTVSPFFIFNFVFHIKWY
jgi:hypothetical protein